MTEATKAMRHHLTQYVRTIASKFEEARRRDLYRDLFASAQSEELRASFRHARGIDDVYDQEHETLRESRHLEATA